MALEWFKSYLGNRQQYVQYKNSKSDTEMIPCGVPQGSVLGPLLFIIYTNDLPNCLKYYVYYLLMTLRYTYHLLIYITYIQLLILIWVL